MGILCPVILPTTCVVSPRKIKFAQRRAVGSELVGHHGGWSDAVLFQEFSHQLERRLAVSPWLNQDVQDLAFAVHGTLHFTRATIIPSFDPQLGVAGVLEEAVVEIQRLVRMARGG